VFNLKIQIQDENNRILPEINRKVAISNGASFKLCFKNPYTVRLEVQLFLNSKVEGKPTKTWILNPYQSDVIETYNEKNLLRFENYEALKLRGVACVKEDFGLISARFKTEMPPDIPSYLAEGGTSCQNFSLTNAITEYGDVDIIYSVRLVEMKVPHHVYA
jgi:hypothetical protein